jgi:lipopolysaccharide export system protein LptA
MTLSSRGRSIVCGFSMVLGAIGASNAQTPGSGAVLPGANGKDPVNIDAAKLDYFDKEQKLIYTGNVIATQGESKLQAGKLVIYLTPKNAKTPAGMPSSSSQVRRMEAGGPVTILSKDQIGTGDSGIYERSENKVYLIGNVTLSQGGNVTKGDKLIYDLATKEAIVTGGRVRSLFLTDEKPGDGKQPRTSRSVGVSNLDQAAQPSDRPPQDQAQ